jgi:hypothetical protein
MRSQIGLFGAGGPGGIPSGGRGCGDAGNASRRGVFVRPMLGTVRCRVWIESPCQGAYGVSCEAGAWLAFPECGGGSVTVGAAGYGRSGCRPGGYAEVVARRKCHVGQS